MSNFDTLTRQILTFIDGVPPPEPQLEVVCAWCFPGNTRPGISHGICPKCRAEMEAAALDVPMEDQ